MACVFVCRLFSVKGRGLTGGWGLVCGGGVLFGVWEQLREGSLGLTATLLFRGGGGNQALTSCGGPVGCLN